MDSDHNERKALTKKYLHGTQYSIDIALILYKNMIQLFKYSPYR